MDKKMVGALFVPAWSRALAVAALRSAARPPCRLGASARRSRPVSLHSRPAVKLNGNRKVTGTLRGFDQFLNLVLDDAVDGQTKESMGMVVLRGCSVLLLEPLERIG